MVQKVGVVGLGLMGLSIAKNLAKAGFQVTGHDSQPGVGSGIEGLATVPDVGSVGRAAEIVLLSLPGPPEVEAVCLGEGGLSGTLASGSIVFDLSTNSQAMVKKIQAAMASKGIAFLDAPVSGGPWGAADGTLAIWVGGDRAAFDRGLPALEAVGWQ